MTRDLAGDLQVYITKIENHLTNRRPGRMSFEVSFPDPIHLLRLLTDAQAYVLAERDRISGTARPFPMVAKGDDFDPRST